jgi:hypothetical protein
MATRKQLRNQALLVSLCAGAIVLPIILPAFVGPPFPGELGSLRLIRSVTGDDARAVVDRLHGMTVSQRQNSIGFFSGENGLATVYVSTYLTAEEARSVERGMAGRIGAGNGVFGHYHRATVEGKDVSICYGVGQAHFFYSAGRRLYWLSADMPVAFEAVRALLTADR